MNPTEYSLTYNACQLSPILGISLGLERRTPAERTRPKSKSCTEYLSLLTWADLHVPESKQCVRIKASVPKIHDGDRVQDHCRPCWHIHNPQYTIQTVYFTQYIQYQQIHTVVRLHIAEVTVLTVEIIGISPESPYFRHTFYFGHVFFLLNNCHATCLEFQSFNNLVFLLLLFLNLAYPLVWNCVYFLKQVFLL